MLDPQISKKKWKCQRNLKNTGTGIKFSLWVKQLFSKYHNQEQPKSLFESKLQKKAYNFENYMPFFGTFLNKKLFCLPSVETKCNYFARKAGYI